MKRLLCLLLLPALLAFEAPLPNATEEARAQALMEEIRCVACENEPISQSNADIAADMRARVRVMISEGASDYEVRAWFSDRYGEFVLFRPSSSGVSGMLLWAGPFSLLVLGGLGLWYARRQKSDKADIVAVGADAYDHEKEKTS